MKIRLVTSICLAFLSWSVSHVAAQTIHGTFAIRNVKTGMLLRPLEASNRNAAPLVGYEPTNWKCMTWDFKVVSGRTYYLKNLLTGKTFQPVGAASEGALLEQQPLADKPDQQWEFIPAGKDQFAIRLQGTELFITPSDESGAINRRIILAGRRPGTSQLWTIYEQHPTM